MIGLKKESVLASQEIHDAAKNVVIVGGRIAGPRAAMQIVTARPELHVTILDKTIPFNSNDQLSNDVQLSSRGSFPLLDRHKLRDLNLLESKYVMWSSLTYHSDNPLNPANLLRKGFFQLLYHIHPKYIVDFEDIRDGLYQNTQQHPHISFVQGEFMNTMMQDGKVMGVKTTDGREFLGAVIDATGRRASVAKNIEKQLQKPIIKERKIKDPISVIGFYVNLSNPGDLEKFFPQLMKQAHVAGTKNGIFGFIGPVAKMQGSTATHIVYLEGFKEKIDTYMTRAQSSVDQQLSSKGLPIPTDDMKMKLVIKEAIMQCLQDRTDKRWHSLADKLQDASIDRIISFSTKGLVVRNIMKQKEPSLSSQFTLVGDAAIQTPPYFGQGFLNIAHEIKKLTKSIKRYSNVEHAFEHYNRSMRREARLFMVKEQIIKAIGTSISFGRR